MQLTRRLVLASRSPRRIALLKQIGLQAAVIPSSIIETFDDSISPEENARSLALAKARAVCHKVADGVIIGADTMVVLDGVMLGKPVDPPDAARMLRMLSGRVHRVITAFALVDCPGDRSITESEETAVTFRVLPSSEIERYVAGGSPMDKAGSYGIQDDYGAVFVSRIEGCFYNVVGFPLSRLYVALQKFTPTA